MAAALTAVGIATGAQAATTQTRSSAFDYDPTSGLLTKEVVEQGNSALCVATVYGLNAYGNRSTATTRNCNGSAGSYSGAVTEAAAPGGTAGYTATQALTDTAVFTARTTTYTYSADQRFVTGVANALGQTETRVFDPVLGVVTSLTGPNLLTTSWAYDGFGRKVLEKRADGNGTKWSYDYCSGVAGGTLACPTISAGVGAYAVTATPVAAPIDITAKTSGAANGPYVRVYYDNLGREIRTETEGDDSVGASTLVYQDTQYNLQGQVYAKTRPYFAGDPAYWTIYAYDLLGRLTQENAPTDTAPSGTLTTTVYSGLTVTVTDALLHTTMQVSNIAGQVATVTDHKGGTLSRDYDPFGNLVRSIDAKGNVTSLVYDTKGRKTAMYDPDMGVWTYAYSALGELRKQKDQKAQLTEMTYDVLGRMLGRYEGSYNSTWAYDSCANGKGKLCQASATNAYSRQHAYDSLGRPTSSTVTIDTAYTASVTYDAAGRVATQTYPTGLSVTSVYSALGYTKQLLDARNGSALFTVTARRDAEGRLRQYQYGNSVNNTLGYAPGTGRLLTSQAGPGNGVQNLSHAYNAVGGLTSRIDVLTGVTATYGYDEINRLLSETRSGGGIAGSQAISWSYDSIGNMTSRTESGKTNTYNYNTSGSGSSRPHAVANVSGTVNGYAPPIYTYDGNGNLLSGAGRTVAWTSFDKADTLTSGAKQLVYRYDSEHERVREVYTLNGAVQRTTYYLNPGSGAGLFYENETGVAGTKRKHYLSFGGMTIGMVVCTADPCTSTANTTTQYWHKDHLGSISVVTNSAGTPVERMAYEPFGKRRNSNGVTDPNGTLTPASTDRGYTGHEHMDEVGLVNMNGRLYDAGLGRFMSADPVVQSPGALQSYNRYAYVWNDPLNGTDPTGYKKLWQQPWVRQVVSVVVAAYTGVYLQPTWAAMAGSSFGGAVLGGSVSGFAAGAITSGNITGAFHGALTGAVVGGIGASGWNDAGLVAGHAAVGCASAAMGGGSCAQGALAAGLSKAAFVAGPEWLKDPTTDGGMDWNKVAAGAAYSGAIGGTAAVIGGGKFANGAQMAAFAYVVNGVATAQRIAVAGLRVSGYACRFGPLSCGAALGATAVGATAGLLWNESSEGADKPAEGTVDQPSEPKSAADKARELGYDRLVKDPPFNPHGQKVFTNGKDFITPDVDQHNGGEWKGFDRRGNRTGTYDADLNWIGK
jgi:RHS repeat-associated protein